MCPRRVSQGKKKVNKPKYYQLPLLEFNDEADIDVLEQSIYDLDPKILALLLQDRTTEKNIIWACDEYVKHGAQYRAECQILPQHTKLILSRTKKTKEEQKNRTRQKAEVFTPSWLCNEMNNNCDEEWFGRKNVFNWTHPDKSWTPTEKIDFKDKDWQSCVKIQKLVQEMVDNLEKECPGCFDDPTKTFIDLYMKSGLYITEIVKHLYNSPKIKSLFPDKQARLRHIFEHQVYGLAPTEIIYRIATAYILGFDHTVSITKYNLRQWDALKSIKQDTLEKDLAKLFPEMKSVKQACIVRHD